MSTVSQSRLKHSHRKMSTTRWNIKLKHTKSMPKAVRQKMNEFVDAYGRINRLLLFSCICPFVQNKQTYRFMCHTRYFVCAVAVLFGFHAFMTYLCVLRLPPNISSMAYYRILKLSQTLGNMYVFGIVAFHLLRSRHAHAAFFDELFHFDVAFTAMVNDPLNYRQINRPFWMETGVFTVYLVLLSIWDALQKPPDSWHQWAFFYCETIQQIGYFLMLFHMRNAINNVSFRYRRITRLLRSINEQSTLRVVTHHFKSHKNVCEQFECITRACDLLARARDRLQEAFASSLLLIYTYNMFAIALSTYIMISSMFYEVKHHELTHMYQIAIQYVSFELPMVGKEVYFTATYHKFGNMVGFHLLLLLILLFEGAFV